MKISMLIVILLHLNIFAEVSLQTIFNEGEKFEYIVNSEQTINQIIQGRKAKQENKNSTRYLIEVLKVNEDGTAEIKCTYKAVSIDLDSGISKVSYDSEKNDKTKIPREAKPLVSLLGKSFTFIINSKNKVTDVKGMKKITDEMIEEATASFSPTVKKQIEGKLRKVYGNTAVTNTMQQLFVFFPGKDVNIGDTWKSDNTIESVFSFKIDNDWTLKGTDGIEAEVSLKSKVTPTNQEFDLNGIKLKHNVSGNQEGIFNFSLSEKRLKSSQTTQTLSGAMKMNRVNIPINITSKIAQKLIKK